MTDEVEWDQCLDVVIVGSGGGGMTAALAATEAGLKPIILEKQGVLGGSTAMSGGIIWMPNNPLMRAEGVSDSRDAGLAYLRDVVGDLGQITSAERQEAFLDAGSAMIAMLQRRGVKFVRCPGYSDYYPNHKGGNSAGRAIEGIPWDSHQLGQWEDKINPGMARGIGLVVKTNESRGLPAFCRSRRGFLIAFKVLLRTWVSRLRRKDLLTNGMSLIGQMTKVALDEEIPIWLNSGVEQLIVDAGRVIGVETTRAGKLVNIRARKGVLLAAGGFERSPEMRRKYSGEQPNEAKWTIANAGNTGEILTLAMELGAKTDLMDEAWWLPVPEPGMPATTLALARQYPGTIFVNADAKRFVNESNSYVEVCKAMYANDAVPTWLIFDDKYRQHYPMIAGLGKGLALWKAFPGKMPEDLISGGWIRQAHSIPELAEKIGLDATDLVATIERFNPTAANGLDPDFGRGQSAYNACLGDPGNKPNPALGPIDQPPYYATKVFPGDVGTCGGVVTDDKSRVLDENDEPIPGLYATGNITATVMGRTYPGAGASIANTMAFGYAAVRHMAGSEAPWRDHIGRGKDIVTRPQN